MSDYRIPDLPSDEELGIDGESLDDEELGIDGEAPPAAPARPGSPAAGAPPPPPGKKGAPPAGTAPPRPWRGPVTLLALLAFAYLAGPDRTLPDPLPFGAPDSVFSSGRAMLDVVEIARRPHPTGSPDHARVRELLVARLREAGTEPEVQTATVLRRQGEVVTAATVRNVLARIPGTASTGAIALVAHYDARIHARGAGDDATGVATILETVRALGTLPPLRNDLLVVLTDAEELGLLGARAFVDEHPWMEDVALVVNVEMRGGGGPSIMFETGTENGWVLQALRDSGIRPWANSLSGEVYRRLPNDTDFTPFREAGVQGLNFAGMGNPHVYHQRWDAPEHLDERTLQHHGDNVLGVVRELAGRDLADVDAPDVVYFHLPLLGLVTYPPAITWALGALLLLGAGLAFALVRVRSRSRGGSGVRGGPGVLGGAAVGFVLAVASVAGTAGGAHVLFLWLQRYHPEFGALHGSAFHVEGWYVAALVAAALSLTVLLLHVARRWFGLGSLALGVVTLPLAGALAVTVLAPTAAMNLQWPVLLSLGGVALVAGVGPAGRPGLLPWLALLALAAGVLAFTAPVVELVWLALSLQASLVVGAIVALAVLLLLPLLDVLREPGGGWAPMGGLLLAAVFVGVGLLHARPAPDRPLPSTLVWALDRDSSSALWATALGPGEAWARERTGAVGWADSLRTLDDWLLGPATYRTRPVEAVAVPPVGVSAEAVESFPAPAGGRRLLRVSLRSLVGAEMLAVTLPASADVFLGRVGGRPVPEQAPEDRSGARRARTVVHWGQPVATLDLELDVGPGVDTLVLDVVEHHLRPGELVGERWFLRPPSLAPDIVTRSDRALMRGAVRVLPADSFPGDSVPGAGMPRDSIQGAGMPGDSIQGDSIQGDSIAG